MVELYLPPSLRGFSPPWDLDQDLDPGAAALQYDLVEALRPRLTVDLGAADGRAFFVLCRSAKDHALDTLLYAVDPFLDDVGRSDAEKVQVAVQGHIHAEFRGIAYLLRATDIDAAAHFAEGSVDLLRVDAARLGRALASVLQLWLPRLAPTAVVVAAGLSHPRRRGDLLRDFEQAASAASLTLEAAGDVGVFALNPGRFGSHPAPLLRALSGEAPFLAQDLLRFYAYVGRHHTLRHEVEGDRAALSRKQVAP